MSTKTKYFENGVWKYRNHINGNQLWNTREDGSLDVGHIQPELTDIKTIRADQQYKDECDINNIMKRFGLTGHISHLARNPGFYGEFSQMQDFHSAAQLISRAAELFMQLPAELRSKFDNDPAKLIDFASDPKNLKEAIKLGLADKADYPSINNDDLNDDDMKVKPRSSSKVKPRVTTDSEEES